MNVRKEKGITLTALVLTIIIITILTSVSVYTGTNLIREANLQSINTNMLQIQIKVKSIEEKVEFNNDDGEEYVGEKLSDDEATELIAKVNSTYVVIDDYDAETDKYYKLKNEDLVNLGLQAIQEDEDYTYVVNYRSNEVIYTKGFKANDQKIHYALSDMVNLD